jgi:hypothetical protein
MTGDFLRRRRLKVCIYAATPLLWVLDVLILVAVSSGLTWREIRSETKAGLRKALNPEKKDGIPWLKLNE